MERTVIKVCFPSTLWQYFSKLFNISLRTIPRVFDYFLFLCVQSVTVCEECVTPALRVMDSVCVNHHTAGHAVTEVRP